MELSRHSFGLLKIIKRRDTLLRRGGEEPGMRCISSGLPDFRSFGLLPPDFYHYFCPHYGNGNQ